MKKKIGIFAAMAMVAIISCKKPDTTTPANKNTASNDSVPAIFKKFYGTKSITRDGDFIVITTIDLPDHKSVYYKGTQWESTMYQAYNGTNTSFSAAPNIIAQQSITFRIPVNPALNSAHTSTPLGPIGISLNGVPFFNQYAAGGAALGPEINSFDQYDGHPTPKPSDMYHYHVEPFWLTQNKGKDAFLGFLLDGFPVYGPLENGKTLTSSDLDVYHGHFGITADYPNGIYHYHTTADAPYINGDGFYGTAGTVSQ